MTLQECGWFPSCKSRENWGDCNATCGPVRFLFQEHCHRSESTIYPQAFVVWGWRVDPERCLLMTSLEGNLFQLLSHLWWLSSGEISEHRRYNSWDLFSSFGCHSLKMMENVARQRLYNFQIRPPSLWKVSVALWGEPEWRRSGVGDALPAWCWWLHLRTWHSIFSSLLMSIKSQ